MVPDEPDEPPVDLSLGDVVVPVSDGEVPIEPELPEEEPPIEPELPVLPVSDEPELPEPFGMISICDTLEPEKLARTWSPSLMSESDAVWPFFVTCVLGLSRSWSESWLFFLSNFWTLPVTSLEPDADAVEPIEEPEP